MVKSEELTGNTKYLTLWKSCTQTSAVITEFRLYTVFSYHYVSSVNVEPVLWALLEARVTCDIRWSAVSIIARTCEVNCNQRHCESKQTCSLFFKTYQSFKNYHKLQLSSRSRMLKEITCTLR
jgi:hypothetical protein